MIKGYEAAQRAYDNQLPPDNDSPCEWCKHPDCCDECIHVAEKEDEN